MRHHKIAFMPGAIIPIRLPVEYREAGPVEIWRIPFTDEEEVEWEAEEVAAVRRKSQRDVAEVERQEELAPLEAKLADDSITFAETKSLLRLRGA